MGCWNSREKAENLPDDIEEKKIVDEEMQRKIKEIERLNIQKGGPVSTENLNMIFDIIEEYYRKYQKEQRKKEQLKRSEYIKKENLKDYHAQLRKDCKRSIERIGEAEEKALDLLGIKDCFEKIIKESGKSKNTLREEALDRLVVRLAKTQPFQEYEKNSVKILSEYEKQYYNVIMHFAANKEYLEAIQNYIGQPNLTYCYKIMALDNIYCIHKMSELHIEVIGHMAKQKKNAEELNDNYQLIGSTDQSLVFHVQQNQNKLIRNIFRQN